ncbi:hypothetical protein HDV05_004924 [Chytridiales sp. JEL 0842]|nr:hypothetical protein HDV05_004924 [Chytridiales sp. JEL 0842]
MASILGDGNTPPIFLDPMVNSPQNQRSLATIFSVIVGFFVVFFLIEIFVVKWITGTERWEQIKREGRDNVKTLKQNFWLLLLQLVSFPKTRKEIMDAHGFNLIPAVFLTLLLISFVLIQDAIGHREAPLWWGDPGTPIIKTVQAQAGLVLLFVSVNGFIVNRIYEYYQAKTEIRKKAAAHRDRSTIPTVSNQAAESINEKQDLPGRIRVQPRGALPRKLSNQSSELVVEGIGKSENHALGNTNENSDIESSSENLDCKGTTPTSEYVQSFNSSIARPNTTDRKLANNFNDKFQYVRRIKHIQPQFNNILWTPGNLVQMFILFIEFVQLASFPYRDLVRYKPFQESLYYQSWAGDGDHVGSKVIGGVQSIFSTIASGLPDMSTQVFTNIQFSVAWWCTFLGFMSGFVMVLLTYLVDNGRFRSWPKLRKYLKRFLYGSWILYFLPLTSIFYLVVLGSFIEPLGCLSSNKVPLWPPKSGASQDEMNINVAAAIAAREAQCAPVLKNPPLHVWFPIVGYIMAYYTITIFKIAYEPRPKEGVISFTTRSEVLNKNGALILLLLYVLIPTNDSSTLRGVLAIFLLIGMIFYQIRIGSSYIRSVNFWRTISFIFVLWMSIAVVFFTHPAQVGFYGSYLQPIGYRPWVRICLVIGLGWLFCFIFYTMFYFFYIRRVEQHKTFYPDGTHPHPTANLQPGEVPTWANVVDEKVEVIIQKAMQGSSKLLKRKASETEGSVQSRGPIPEVLVHEVVTDSLDRRSTGTIRSTSSKASGESSDSGVGSSTAKSYKSGYVSGRETPEFDPLNIRGRVKGPRSLLSGPPADTQMKRESELGEVAEVEYVQSEKSPSLMPSAKSSESSEPSSLPDEIDSDTQSSSMRNSNDTSENQDGTLAEDGQASMSRDIQLNGNTKKKMKGPRPMSTLVVKGNADSDVGGAKLTVPVAPPRKSKRMSVGGVDNVPDSNRSTDN